MILLASFVSQLRSILKIVSRFISIGKSIGCLILCGSLSLGTKLFWVDSYRVEFMQEGVREERGFLSILPFLPHDSSKPSLVRGKATLTHIPVEIL